MRRNGTTAEQICQGLTGRDERAHVLTTMGGQSPLPSLGARRAQTMVKLGENHQHPITRDTPLPGFYPCLTLQLNVTRYQSGGMGRMVLVVREPSAGHEVHRAFIDTVAWEQVAAKACHELFEALSSMVWMQEGLND